MTLTLDVYITNALIASATQNPRPPSQAYIGNLKTVYEAIYGPGIQMEETQ